jgi:hypothetical protein
MRKKPTFFLSFSPLPLSFCWISPADTILFGEIRRGPIYQGFKGKQKWTTTRQDAKAHLKVPSYVLTTAVSLEALPQ